jgi:hypothetical protein
VILLTDQNFPAVLPTGSGNCLAILLIDHGKLTELTDLLFSIAPDQLPQGTIFVLGSLSQLQGEVSKGMLKLGSLLAASSLIGSLTRTLSSSPPPPPPHGRVWEPSAH